MVHAMATSHDNDEELRRLRRKLDGEDERDAARALLDPGEALRELGDAEVAFGDTGPVSDSQPIEVKRPGWFDRAWAFVTRTTFRKVVFFIVLAPLILYSALDSIGPNGLVERMIGGRTCVGPRGSRARLMAHAMSALGPRANRMVVSDRRVLLVRSEPFADPPQLRPIESVALTDIAAARHRPRGLARRRVELSFTDGSRIVLALPLFRAPSPERFLAALPPAAD